MENQEIKNVNEETVFSVKNTDDAFPRIGISIGKRF